MVSAELFPHHHDPALATALFAGFHNTTGLHCLSASTVSRDWILYNRWLGELETRNNLVFINLRYHKHLPGLRIISCVLKSTTNGPYNSIGASSSISTLISSISDHLQQRLDCIGRPTDFRKRRLNGNIAPLQHTDQLTHLPPDLTHSVFF